MGLLEDIVRLELSIQRRVNDVDPSDVAAQMAEVQRMLRKLAELNERLAGQVDESPAGDERARAEDVCREHDQEHRRLRVELRKMAVRARKVAAERHAEARSALLTRSDATDAAADAAALRQRKGKPAAAAMVRDAKDVTGTLKRARQMMVSEIDRLQSVTDLLEDDTKTMDDTMTEHKLYQGSVARSGAHLGKLKRRDLTDKVVIGAGVLLFACVVLYILWRRLRHIWGIFA
uniref:Sec20 C-terminal domain-containing protein n=1 Tax=Bicosoecida sp. CB-2014 TaxID=1486930 RepID=A0A7S1CRS3_9STRA|mmetsp:Transcript_9472/g.33320  ORF Transcript_9472/g.33320 Transcript_9472/m.33320 type:complete len:233 (+) Transcript_9472:158-856(+)